MGFKQIGKIERTQVIFSVQVRQVKAKSKVKIFLTPLKYKKSLNT